MAQKEFLLEVLFEEMTRYLGIFFSSWKASRSN